MHQYIDVWVSNPKPAASSVLVSYKCIKLYISATIQPILMNEPYPFAFDMQWSYVQQCKDHIFGQLFL